MQEIKSKEVHDSTVIPCPKCEHWTDMEIGPDMLGTVFWVMCDSCQHQFYVEVVLAIASREAPPEGP